MLSIGRPLSDVYMVLVKKYLVVSVASVRNYTAAPLKPRKCKAEGVTLQRFVDFKKIRVIGGNGGNGCLSFLSESGKEFAGPDGGDGGNGGHIILTSTKNLNSLNHLKTEIRAESGVKGATKNRHGKNAEHTYVQVPRGTIVRDMDGNTLSNLEDERDYYVAARGGAGGKGNHHFATSEETTPRFAETGAEGENRQLYVELKTMAHAGLIGFPNAGKSTLLRAISRARPKVAPYPFTTLHPHVGMVQYDDFEQVAVADIPGLIPGAHLNKGLGISFLRHIERCVCLLYVLDLSVSEPWKQLEQLKYELEQYQTGLSERPHAIIGNKMDLDIARENFIELKKHTDLPVFPISAEKRLNIKPLLVHLRNMYDIYGEKAGLAW